MIYREILAFNTRSLLPTTNETNARYDMEFDTLAEQIQKEKSVYNRDLTATEKKVLMPSIHTLGAISYAGKPSNERGMAHSFQFNI